MANPEHLKILKSGVKQWNEWRLGNEINELGTSTPDLTQAYLSGTHLTQAYLREVYLQEADLMYANLIGANLKGANLKGAILIGVNLSGANLEEADLSEANLGGANLEGTNLTGANLYKADLSFASLVKANLIKAHLYNANLEGANLEDAYLPNVNLARAQLIRTRLINAHLPGVNLFSVYLIQADLAGSNLNGANLYKADLTEANLSKTTLEGATLVTADLNNANLKAANLKGADLRNANLQKADLSETSLGGANLCYVNFENADLTNAYFENSIVGFTDLTKCIGLETIRHQGPSIIEERNTKLDYKNLPRKFLEGCGLNKWQIEAIRLSDPGLNEAQITDIVYKIDELRNQSPIQLYNLFISYSRKDDAFAEYLEKVFKSSDIRCWRDVHHMTAGPVEKQIDNAIRVNETVLLILSEHSVSSDWVEYEVSKARELEKSLNRHVICPIALDHSWKDAPWPGVIMNQVKKYNILDFSEWEKGEAFNTQFAKLLKGLNIYYRK